ncbi:unnamed protein product, partial [Didymodactylos carnosus]
MIRKSFTQVDLELDDTELLSLLDDLKCKNVLRDNNIPEQLRKDHPMKNVIISEDLSRKNAKIFTTARQRVQKSKRHQIFSSNGRVFYRNSANQVIHLKTLPDIDKLLT